MRLVVDAVFLWIKPCRYIERKKRSCPLSQSGGILSYRDGMHIYNTVETFIFITQRNPVLQCPQVVAKRQIPGCLHAAK